MKKYVFSALSITLFVSNCKVHQAIPSDKLFEDINKTHDFRQYKLALKTSDSIIYLANPKLDSIGNLKAEIAEKSVGGKEMRFISKSKSREIVTNLIDSSESKTSSIQFSQEAIWGIDVLDEVKTPGRHLIYKRHKSAKKRFINTMLYVLLGIAAFFSIIGLFGLFFYLAENGCYIATMVYGSYDAPEVLVLRKFRDEKLAPYFFGVVLIKLYYTFSPTFVMVFKNNKLVRTCIKSILDHIVISLSSVAVEKPT